jgi:excisionase family DNA binding protein
MVNTCLSAIIALVNTAPDIDEAQRKNILAACTRKNIHRKMIKRKEVLALLGVSRPTLLQYIRDKKVREVRMSSRKIRFYYDEVLDFAQNGETAVLAKEVKI